MARRPRKTFDQYLRESFERDPELASVYEETRTEGQLALSLARVREERRMTQRQLAAASGIAQPVISRLERGAETPTIVTLQKLARALDAQVEINAERAEFHIAMPISHSMPPSLNAFLGNTVTAVAASGLGVSALTGLLASGVQSLKEATISPPDTSLYWQQYVATIWGPAGNVAALPSPLFQQALVELSDNSVRDVTSTGPVASEVAVSTRTEPRSALALAS